MLVQFGAMGKPPGKLIEEEPYRGPVSQLPNKEGLLFRVQNLGFRV